MNALDPLRRLAERIDARERRERLLLAATAVVVVLALWEFSVRAPLAQRHASAVERIDRIEQEIEQYETTRAGLQDQLEALRAGEGKRTLARLRQRIEQMDQRLTAKTRRVVPPKEMVEVVRDVVAGDPGVKLVKLANAGVEPLITESEPVVTGSGAEIEARHVPRVYRHRIELTVRARYLDLLGYVRRLQQAPWRFQWDALEIETIDYPMAQATIELSTLSFEQEWIGV